MAYDDLQQFLADLESSGELHRVKTQVSPKLEISEITDRISKASAASLSEHARQFDPGHANFGGKALLFENVEGSDIPVSINAFGSYTRMEKALGCEGGGYETLARKVGELAKPQPPVGLMNKVRKGLELAKVAALPPKVVKRGHCQDIVKTGDEVDLFELPLIQCWPDDGDPRKAGFTLSPEDAGTAKGEGRYITLGGMYTIHPDDAGKPEGEPRPSRNVGMYRAQLIDKAQTAMHWHMHHDGARHWREWKKRGEPMPLAIALGGESVLPYAATAPMPPGLSELLFAGFLHGKSIPLVKCQTIDMHVPANAEIVIEGYVATEAGFTDYNPDHVDARGRSEPIGEGAVFEGPFGDHTAFYSLPDRYPCFNVTAITHRKEPVYPTTIVGWPPQEDYYMGKATERLFLPLLQTIVPDVLDYHLPMFGAFHNCAFLQIKKEYPLQARRVMHAIWGAGQMAWTKMLIVVDQDVNVHDQEQVLFHLCANIDPGRDMELVNGPLDILDHAAARLGAGQKVGFDATAKWLGEEVNGHAVRAWPDPIRMDDATKNLVDERWREYGFD